MRLLALMSSAVLLTLLASTAGRYQTASNRVTHVCRKDTMLPIFTAHPEEHEDSVATMAVITPDSCLLDQSHTTGRCRVPHNGESDHSERSSGSIESSLTTTSAGAWPSKVRSSGARCSTSLPPSSLPKRFGAGTANWLRSTGTIATAGRALYARMSPFWRAHKVKDPILLIHGGMDDNSYLPDPDPSDIAIFPPCRAARSHMPMQARNFHRDQRYDR